MWLSPSVLEFPVLSTAASIRASRMMQTRRHADTQRAFRKRRNATRATALIYAACSSPWADAVHVIRRS